MYSGTWYSETWREYINTIGCQAMLGANMTLIGLTLCEVDDSVSWKESAQYGKVFRAGGILCGEKEKQSNKFEK